MLFCSFDFIQNNRLIKLINRFVYSPYYALTVALLMAASNVLGMEFFVFYTYLTFGVYITLFAPDGFGLAHMFCCGYMLFSAANNPASHYEDNFLSTEEGMNRFITVVIIAFVIVMSRLVYDIAVNKRYKGALKLKLNIGFLALGAVYILSGFMSEHYSSRTVIFGLVEIISLCATYYLFAFTVDWEKRTGADFAYLFTAVGVGMLIEVIGMYCAPHVIEAIQNGKMNRSLLVSGWGVYNNVGGMMAMMVPAPFYLALKNKFGSLWIAVGFLFFGGVVLTQSRTSIVAAAIVLVLCIVVLLICSDRKRRIFHVYTLFGIFAVLAAVCSFYISEIYDKITSLFSFEKLFGDNVLNHPNGRLTIYKFGFDKFLESPIFGNGFYISEGSVPQLGGGTWSEGAFLPPRFHNTYIQLLACGGIAAMAGYVVHRAQTVYITVKSKSRYGYFAALSVLTVIIASLFDCHFFNMGPGLCYGVLLISIERLGSDRT